MAVWTSVISLVVMSVVVIVAVMGLSEGIREYPRLRRRRLMYEQLAGGRHTHPMRPSLKLENLLAADSDSSYQNYKNKLDKTKPRDRHFYTPKLLNLNEFDIRSRRSFNPVTYKEACDTISGWERIQYALDSHNNNVSLVQDGVGSLIDQKFFVIKCTNENCCFGIDTTRFNSRCKQEYTFVPATVRSPTDESLTEVRMVSYASRCVCLVSERVD